MANEHIALVICASKAGPLGSLYAAVSLPPLRDFGLTILSKSLLVRRYLIIHQLYWALESQITFMKLFQIQVETCLEGKRYVIKDTQRDHLNLSL